MNKTIYFAAFALFAASCVQKTYPEIPKADDCVIRASLSGYTKTSVAQDDGALMTYWTSGDMITVNGRPSRPLSIESACSSADFHIDGYNPSEGEIMNILYSGAQPAYGPGAFHIPEDQTYTGGNYPDGAAPMWSTCDYPQPAVMNSLCSMLGFAFHSSGPAAITGMTLRSVANEPISGVFNMGYHGGRFSGAHLAAGDNGPVINIVFDKPLQLSAGAPLSVNVPVLAASFASGLELKVYSGDKYAVYGLFSDGRQLQPAKAYAFPDTEFRPDNSRYTLEDYDENILFDTQVFAAGTYNILAADGRSSCPNNTWDAAKASIVSAIKDMDCDIMTLNELSDTEVNDLKKMLSGYSWVTKKNSYHNGTFLKYYEMSYCPGIIYKETRFEKLDDGIFWLCDPETDHIITDNKTGQYSYTDPKDGTVYSAGQSRCCVWARFRDILTDRQFFWFAPHPHVRSTDAASSLASSVSCLNAGNIRRLVRQIGYVNAAGLPFVVAGDMNTWSGHVSYREVLSATGWANAFEQALENGCLDAEAAVRRGTNPGYDPANYSYGENRRIDHVCSSGFSLNGYRTYYVTYRNQADGLDYLPSDHVPVRVMLKFK